MKRLYLKRRRAARSGVKLSVGDAAMVKGMLRRGDRQHDIAAWFGVNGGRIAEIAMGKAFPHVEPEGPDLLPPEGPYPSGRAAIEAQWALDQALNALATAEASLGALRTRTRHDPERR